MMEGGDGGGGGEEGTLRARTVHAPTPARPRTPDRKLMIGDDTRV